MENTDSIKWTVSCYKDRHAHPPTAGGTGCGFFRIIEGPTVLEAALEAARQQGRNIEYPHCICGRGVLNGYPVHPITRSHPEISFLGGVSDRGRE